MRTHDEMPADHIAGRMARVNAQYESNRHRGGDAQALISQPSAGVVETPCRLAPAVRRRSAQPRPQ